MAQMKEQIKTPEKELSGKEIDNLRCRVQNTDDQDALRNDWPQSQNEGRNEGYTKWNEENIQGTNSEGKETGT